MLQPLLIGCHRHCINLVIKEIPSDYDHICDKVHALMQKLSKKILVAKLRKLTQLTAKSWRVTRCTLMFYMHDCIFKLREYIFELGLAEIDALYPEDDEIKELNALTKELRRLEPVTKALQDKRATLEEAQTIFDAVVHLNPVLESS